MAALQNPVQCDFRWYVFECKSEYVTSPPYPKISLPNDVDDSIAHFW